MGPSIPASAPSLTAGTQAMALQMSEPAIFDTPVLLLIFNRPDTTRQVMESIRRVQPKSLYVAADGPREGRREDENLCQAARDVAATVDWPCKVRTLYRNNNLGCAVGVSTAVTWFFQEVGEGIVLEDDCIPSISFYRFCQELLGHYRDEPRIMHIAGTNLQYGRRRGRESYYYSRLVNIWGWASWRRAWNLYDFSLRPSWRLEDTWDTQWQLSVERAQGLAIVPNKNLVKNIGFGPQATHTVGGERAESLVAEEMDFPLRHPREIRPHEAADLFTYYAHHRQVRFPDLLPWYRLLDWTYPRLKRLKRLMTETWRSPAAAPDEEGGGGRATNALVPGRERLKGILKAIRVPILRNLIRTYFGWRRGVTEAARYRRWVEVGHPAPAPPLYKQRVVRDAGNASGNRVLVETGTFEGQMVEAVAHDYSRIYTIELDASLSARASEQLRDKPHITVLHGDSVEVLPRVLGNLHEPAVFWLDAHFSGGPTAGNADESPIMHELRAISKHALSHQHVILIDDAREFTGGAYPTLAAVEDWARMSGYDSVLVEHDIIRVSSSRGKRS